MQEAPGPGDTFEVNIDRIATGGEGVGRLPDGRVVFVAGALPGERAQVELLEVKRRWSRGQALDIAVASAERREMPCAHAQTGECGGCDWIHIDPQAQRSFKTTIVEEQLQRLGGIDAPHVQHGQAETGLRSTVRCSVVEGRAGYRRRRSNDAFAATMCGAVEPALEELIVDGRFGASTEVTLRIGAATGERLAMVNGDPHGVHLPPDVAVVSDDAPGDAAIHERVGGRAWRISAKSFFQTSRQGAEALVAAVNDAVADGHGDVVDLYGGVGLLGGAVAADSLHTMVEWSESSIADAKHNLPDHVEIVRQRVERWTPGTFGTVIADPARRGLGEEGVGVVGSTNATCLALVSCDPAALGRDIGLLVRDGWRHDRSVVIDMFPDTSRLEVVSTLSR